MNSSQAKLDVVIFKSNDESAEPSSRDRYVEYLQANKIDTLDQIKQTNLLKFDFINSDRLKAKLSSFFLHSTLGNDYRCLILTSRTTIEAIELAFAAELGELESSNDENHVTVDDSLNELGDEKLIIYCVGEATKARLMKLISRFKRINGSFDRRVIVRMPSSLKQNAAELAKLITADYETCLNRSSSFATHVFYPCSSIRKDDLGKALAAASITYEELHVYRTITNESTLAELEIFLNDAIVNSTHSRLCLVFFSPSGVDALFSSTGCVSLVQANLHRFRFVSIGPSTTAKLKSLHADFTFIPADYEFVQLDKPSPEALHDKLTHI